ncbi:MAG: AEC family transporter [Alicyclobacillaceae bacterium]|nr:AEC family transporter [Alicyclobacillaceae bacterium]
MSEYGQVATTVSIPILLAILGGALLDRFRGVDTRSLADVGLYIMAPSLVLFALTDVSGGPEDAAAVAAFTLLNVALLWGMGEAAGRLARLPKEALSALVLTTVFGNSNNYGLPVVLLAFGAEGFSKAALYVAGQVLLMYTLGIFLASRATHAGRGAWREVFHTPVVYAAVAGAGMAWLGWRWPEGLDNALRLLGMAYPAVVLMILGVQLGRAKWRGIGRRDLWLAVGLRLAGGPAAAFLCVYLLDLHGLMASVLFVEASMPAAVNAAVLAEQFGGDRDLAAQTVAVTTAASFVLLPLLVVAARML